MKKRLTKERDSEIKKKPVRVRLTREEVLKNMADLPARKEKIIAAIRKAKD
jgi:hypothetical protein